MAHATMPSTRLEAGMIPYSLYPVLCSSGSLSV
uniref:Uncharacterized protein n=1 Tax=Utricularia reniformis TaxID=192314 RepID=A0A1Y0B2W4_9LAMI|nr:hypothetical protein AEK19_MT1593 [Utricularia reniformis]ART31776.1 hypothetical protein AEK19_MT1593 [Utricularia reniformis]